MIKGEINKDDGYFEMDGECTTLLTELVTLTGEILQSLAENKSEYDFYKYAVSDVIKNSEYRGTTERKDNKNKCRNNRREIK